MCLQAAEALRPGEALFLERPLLATRHCCMGQKALESLRPRTCTPCWATQEASSRHGLRPAPSNKLKKIIDRFCKSLRALPERACYRNLAVSTITDSDLSLAIVFSTFRSQTFLVGARSIQGSRARTTKPGMLCQKQLFQSLLSTSGSDIRERPGNLND